MREELFRQYIADSMKALIESYHSAHDHQLDMPRYRDFDSIVKDHTKKGHEDTAEDIKDRIFKKLRKAERKR